MIKKNVVGPSDAPGQDGLTRPARMRLFSGDKAELEQRIQAEVRAGWELVSRSYSLDDGHGAELVRREVRHAA
ncbi:MAG: hypothetical protein NT159_07395 [Proteobacteria bacterium]|nr:hypothetical protein [Pseudomonadota bacterium]